MINRLKQRYDNFEKAYKALSRMANQYELSTTEVNEMALIQAFEFTYEVAWKLLKAYLASEGMITKTPREAIKNGFQQEIIEEGETWLKAISVRNETVHTYDESIRHRTAHFIAKEFFPEVRKLYNRMKEKYETWHF